jgi:ABC-type nitrate/sulfonate/bicarbonate transport system substrate-binding protein
MGKTFMKIRAAMIYLIVAVCCMADPVRAAAKTHLRVAYSSISGSAVVPFIALDKGLFARSNLAVELIYVAGSQAMQSLLSGTTPIGIQGIEPVFRVNAHGGDTAMILGLVTKPPFSIISRPEIKDYLELKGKPMGVSRYGSSTDLLLRLVLDKWGFKPEMDVPILQMGGVPPILAGMQAKKIFAGPLSLPTLARAKQEGLRTWRNWCRNTRWLELSLVGHSSSRIWRWFAVSSERSRRPSQSLRMIPRP